MLQTRTTQHNSTKNHKNWKKKKKSKRGSGEEKKKREILAPTRSAPTWILLFFCDHPHRDCPPDRPWTAPPAKLVKVELNSTSKQSTKFFHATETSILAKVELTKVEFTKVELAKVDQITKAKVELAKVECSQPQTPKP